MITIGRIVFYRLTQDDVDAIQRRRTNSALIAKALEAGNWPEGAQAHIGNPVNAGEIVPLMVTQVWPNEYGPDFHGINGQCLLDGNDSLWVTSIKEGEEPGTWHWPPRV